MRRAVTLVELLVSVMILALIIAGLANIFFTSRRYITFSRSRTQAAEFSKTVLDNLYKEVRQDT
ncbi:MAG: prepilin-type N-terminal cleavage/methylation domain-containing protein, partial [Candidatus Omnitrophica bacterium]|nr:prepilin-type N-terminal cleavage/methylation domain-containing protein [Candidatus Omnitrophota bacterium]